MGYYRRNKGLGFYILKRYGIDVLNFCSKGGNSVIFRKHYESSIGIEKKIVGLNNEFYLFKNMFYVLLCPFFFFKKKNRYFYIKSRYNCFFLSRYRKKRKRKKLIC